MKKATICLFALGFIVFSLVFTQFILTETGTIHQQEELMFDIDSENNIYLGDYRGFDKKLYIEVISPAQTDTSAIRTIVLNKGRFFIIREDLLLIGCPYKKEVEVYDLYGNYMEKSNISYEETERESNYRIKARNDSIYTSNTSLWHPYTIEKDNETIYQMSTLDYIFNGTPMNFVLAVFFIFVAIFVMLKLNLKGAFADLHETEMRFKRYRSYFFAAYTILIIITLVFIRFLISTSISKNQSEFVPTMIAFVLYMFCVPLASFLTFGYYAQEIYLSKEGIELRGRKGFIQRFNWEDVSKIICSRYMGFNTLVVISQAGDDIWFCESKKVKNDIFSVCPRMESLLVKERQPWEHKSTKTESAKR